MSTTSGSKRRSRGFTRAQWLMLAALIAVLAFTAFFAIRAAKGILYWDAKAERPVRGWMTISQIARTHGVPEAVLNRALDLPADAHDPRPLARIAHDGRRPVREIVDKVNNAILEHHAFNPGANAGQPSLEERSSPPSNGEAQDTP
ncbi:MAG: hypothetical protein ACK4S4_01795 [Pyrinomonadaceae bacterium]